jgi:hypothetical protein
MLIKIASSNSATILAYRFNCCVYPTFLEDAGFFIISLFSFSSLVVGSKHGSDRTADRKFAFFTYFKHSLFS